MANFKPGVIDKLLHANARRILKLDDAIAKAEAAGRPAGAA